EERWRAIGQHDLLHEGFEIDLVLGEVGNVTLAKVAQHVLGEALPAPIQGRDRKAAQARLLDNLEILFDELGPTIEQAERALAARRRRKPGEAQCKPVRGLDGSGDRALRDRVRRDRDERHAEPSAAARRPYSRADGRLNVRSEYPLPDKNRARPRISCGLPTLNARAL